MGIGLVNAMISTAQEVRAKRQLDRIALVSAPRVAVVREGRERSVDPAELVVGDVVKLGSGDQVVVDGTVVGDGSLEVDESLLTGGEKVEARNVHDAWSAWMSQSNPRHDSIRPFEQLTVDVQAQDEPFAEAIRKVAANLR